MKPICTIANEAQTKELPFSFLNKMTIEYHGLEQTSRDVDFVVLSNDFPRWQNLLSSHGYEPFLVTDTFIQLKRAGDDTPIVLMLVDESTLSLIKNTPFVM